MSNRTEQGYLSHTALGISEQLWLGLIWMKGMLEDGKIEHSSRKNILGRNLQYFNMNDWNCGSVGCIGGWVESKFKCDPDMETRDNPKLGLLFYPNVKFYSVISTEQAAAAIDNYLRTGDPKWDLATGRPTVYSVYAD